jgi:hypothetical protein
MNESENYDVAEIKKRVGKISLRSCCHTHWYEDFLKLDKKDKDFIFSPFIVCSVCGNKRCPKATDCNLECHGSNAEGQPGSIYA